MRILILIIGGLLLVALGTLITTFFVTVFLGAGFQTLGIDGPGWKTVFWFVFAARAALAGNSISAST